MKLFFGKASCSMAAHIALHESKLPFSTESVNLGSGQFQGGELSQVNPKGYVPVLELDNRDLLTEGAVILQYIADQAPEMQLIPKSGTWERYRCQEWLNYIATEVHKGFAPLWNDQSPESVKTATQEDLGKKFDYLSRSLKDVPFLMGAQYTVADSYLFTILNWTSFLKMDLSKWPVLQSYIERIKSRPATQETLKSEGLLRKA